MLLFMLTMETPVDLTDQLNDCFIQMAQGDAHALERLYQLTHKGVYAYALSVVKNPQDAADMMQETYITAFRNSDQYENIGKPMAWLITITRNLCYGLLRRKDRFSHSEEEMEQRSCSQESFEQIENNDLLRFCLSVLTQEERQILVLHVVWGLKHREIAQLLSMNVSTVLSKYHRSIQKCKQYLLQHKEELL